jgi:hypothetical protein
LTSRVDLLSSVLTCGYPEGSPSIPSAAATPSANCAAKTAEATLAGILFAPGSIPFTCDTGELVMTRRNSLQRVVARVANARVGGCGGGADVRRSKEGTTGD